MANAASTQDVEKVEVEVDISGNTSISFSTRESTFDNGEDVALHMDQKGWWGLVVCLGAFFIQFFMLGVQNSAGIIYTALVDEFNTPRGVTGEVLENWVRGAPTQHVVGLIMENMGDCGKKGKGFWAIALPLPRPSQSLER